MLFLAQLQVKQKSRSIPGSSGEARLDSVIDPHCCKANRHLGSAVLVKHRDSSRGGAGLVNLRAVVAIGPLLGEPVNSQKRLQLAGKRPWRAHSPGLRGVQAAGEANTVNTPV